MVGSSDDGGTRRGAEDGNSGARRGAEDDSTDSTRRGADGEARRGAAEDEPAGDDDLRAVARKWQSRAEKDARRVRQLETQLAQIEDQGKSELQRAIERADAAERARGEAELRSLRVDVAARKGLPPGMAARLKGTTEDELETDADELVKLLGKDSSEGDKPGPRRDPDQGKGNGSSATPGGEMNDWMRRAAGRPA